jgi:hypothetical protein
MDSRYGRTRFSDFTHAQLVQMLAAGRLPDVRAAADGWRDVANVLDDVALTLERQGAGFREYWEGPAATAHAAMVEALVDGVQQVAWTARRISDQLGAAGDALRRAQERMAALGPPVDLHPPDQGVVVTASAPLPYGQPRVEAAAQRAAAIRAVQDFQRTRAAAGAAAAMAVAIMEELRDAYLNVEFPQPPAIAEPPTVAADGTPVFPAVPAPGAGARLPLFTDLWRNGLVAAAGMPAGEILRPYQPAPAGVPGGSDPPPSDMDRQPPPVDLARDIPAGDASLSSGGSFPGGRSFSGGGSFPGLGDSLASDPARAVGQSSLAPTINPAAAAVGGAGGLGGTAVPPFLGGFAPPLGGAGGEFGGIGGRGGAAAWLVGEVEEFGVKSPVVPDVVD